MFAIQARRAVMHGPDRQVGVTDFLECWRGPKDRHEFISALRASVVLNWRRRIAKIASLTPTLPPNPRHHELCETAPYLAEPLQARCGSACVWPCRYRCAGGRRVEVVCCVSPQELLIDTWNRSRELDPGRLPLLTLP